MPEEIPPSEPTPEVPAAPAAEGKQIRRSRIGLNVTMQIILGTVLFLLVNYLGFRHFTQWDKTYNREFTLSEDTQAFLKQLDKRITISVISQKGTDEQRDIWQLVEQYHREGKSKIKIEMIDPIKDPDAFAKASDEAVKRKISLDNLGLFLRVTKGGDKDEKPADGKDATLPATFIAESTLFRYTNDINKRPVLTAFNGEAAITGGLMAIARGDKPKIYVVSGKKKTRITSMGNPVTVLKNMALRQNMELLPLLMNDTDRIPEDASIVALMGIEDDLDDRELQMLREYWHGNHHGILVMFDGQNPLNCPKLEKFLAENGVAAQDDRVLRTYRTGTGAQKLFDVKALYLDGNPITNAQKGTYTSFIGKTRSLKLDPDAQIPRAENIQIKPLIVSTDDYWGETRWDDEAPQLDEADNKPPLYLSASLERGASKDSLIGMESSRMVVIGNSNILDPDTLQASHSEFVNSCVSWLIQHDNYIGINPTPKSTYSIQMTESQKLRVFVLTTVVLPALVLLLGVLVWSARRS